MGMNWLYHGITSTQQGRIEFDILAFLFFAMAAFLAWRDQKRISQEVIAQMDKLQNSHSEHTSALKEQTKVLEAQLDDRARRKKIKDMLGSWHIDIQNLASELKRINMYEYVDEKRADFEKKVVFTEEAILFYLEKKMGQSESAIFRDTTQIPKVPWPDMEDAFTERSIARLRLNNRLEHRAKQLEAIMAKLDSRDFVLPPQS